MSKMNVLITQVYDCMLVLIVLNCFKQSPTKTKLAMVRAAYQSLRIECNIMLRHPGEQMHSTYFLKGYNNMLNLFFFNYKPEILLF